MEYLDKKSKRIRSIKLFTGYGLIAVMICLATLILVFLAKGYGYSPDKGVMHNGLVFVDSKPGSAEVTLDGQAKDRTGSRLIVSEGTHSLTIKAPKYRDWSKTFTLDGGSVLYFTYPRLFPVDIAVGITRVYPTPPTWASQSLDRHWLVIQNKSNTPVLTVVDLLKPKSEPVLNTIPREQLSSGDLAALSAVEWSDDNRHLLLLEQGTDGKKSYIMFDRENSDLTVNVSEKLNLPETAVVSLRDKKYDKYYIHDPATGELRVADLKNGITPAPLLKDVVSYKSYADNLILYATYKDAKPGEASIFILNNRTDKYMLQSLPRDPNGNYLLDLAQFDHNWYVVTASHSDSKVLVYRNPLSRTKPGNSIALKPQMNLALSAPAYLSFSGNARFIVMQSGKKFVVFDGEQNRVFRYESPLNIAAEQKVKWMDGHRLSVVTDSMVQVFEFDGTNQQTLIGSRPDFLPYFDRDYKYVYTLVNQADGKVGFADGQLILN